MFLVPVAKKKIEKIGPVKLRPYNRRTIPHLGDPLIDGD